MIFFLNRSRAQNRSEELALRSTAGLWDQTKLNRSHTDLLELYLQGRGQTIVSRNREEDFHMQKWEEESYNVKILKKKWKCRNGTEEIERESEREMFAMQAVGQESGQKYHLAQTLMGRREKQRYNFSPCFFQILLFRSANTFVYIFYSSPLNMLQ